MSTSGIYNYHPVISQGPGRFFSQLSSQQPPFFFGGSQIPSTLGFTSGSGLQTSYRSSVIDGLVKPVNKNIQNPATGKFRSTVIPKKLPNM